MRGEISTLKAWIALVGTFGMLLFGAWAGSPEVALQFELWLYHR